MIQNSLLHNRGCSDAEDKFYLGLPEWFRIFGLTPCDPKIFVSNSGFCVDLFEMQNCGCLTANLLPKRNASNAEGLQRRSSGGWKGSNTMAIVGAGVMGMLGLAGSAYADEAEHGLAAPSYPWAHDGWFSSYDHTSLVSFTLHLARLNRHPSQFRHHVTMVYIWGLKCILQIHGGEIEMDDEC